MTMLTHARGPFERARYSSGSRDPAGAGVAAATYLALIKRFFMRVLMVLAAGGFVAAIMTLKVAIYLPRFVHL
jgi:hypothetical protein